MFDDFKNLTTTGWVPVNSTSEVHLNDYDLDYLSRTRSGAWKKLLDNFNQGGCRFTGKQLYRRGWRVVKIDVCL